MLAVVAEIEPAGSEEIAEQLDYTRSTVQNRTYELEAAGWIERAGKGHSGRVLFTLSTTDSYDHLFAHEYPEVVEFIRNHGAVSANTIAERFGMGRSAARTRIDNLEAEGSVEFVGEGYRGCHLYSTTESLEGEL